LEPKIAGQQINLSIAIDVKRCHAFGISELSFARSPGFPRKDFSQRPCISLAWLRWHLGEKNFLRTLIPKCQLRLAGAQKIAEHLVMMLGCPTFLNYVALPGGLWTEIWVRVFPPPDLITLPVTPEDNVKVPIAIDIVNRS